MEESEHDMRDTHMQYEHDLSTRVTRVESAVETLTLTMNDVSTSIKHIERAVSSIGKTDVKTLAVIAGSVGSVVLAIWFVLIAPVNIQLVNFKEEYEKLDRIEQSRATIPGDVLRIESACNDVRGRIDAMERREAATGERAKFVEDLVKEMGNTQKKTK